MQYVAVQVMTKMEAAIASRIRRRAMQSGLEIRVVPPGETIFKYGTEGSDIHHISGLPGYILIGFKKWENRIYHAVKEVFGVIRVLIGEKIGNGYSGIMSEDEVQNFLNVEMGVEVEVTENHDDMAERLLKQLEKCREYIEKKKNKAVRWIAVPFSYVSDAFADTTPEFLNNEDGKAFRRIWERLSRLLKSKRRAL